MADIHQFQHDDMLLKSRKTPSILSLLIFSLFIIQNIAARGTSTDYVPSDYIWRTPSENSAGSMPCGGGDIGMNVWVENGDVLFYLSKSGMFDENNTLLKAGRMRLHIDGSPFGGETFEQRLCLNDGAMYIKDAGIEIRLWADVQQPKVFMEIKSKKKNCVATLSYESWRYKDRPVTKEECQQCSYKWLIPKDCKTFADSIKPLETELLFQHANRQYTVFDYTVNREGLDSIKQQLDNPIGGLVFGGKISMPGFKFTGTSKGVYASTDYMAWNYTSSALWQTTVSIDLYTGESEAKPLTASQSKMRSAKWWHAYWQRSYIIAAGDAGNMARNYELFRYMLGCNAKGDYPTKFNGSLFTFDPVYADAKCPFTPDYRRWGGGTMTAQNQRLVYWPMLKSGDVDLMKSQFDTYLRMSNNAMLRTRFYWGHDGASFTEQIENFGLPNPAEYGKHKSGDDMGTERNAWLEYLWDTSLEFCSMILQANKYCGMNISRYESLIEQSLLFFDEHYQYLAKKQGVKSLNGDGKLVLYPASGCETYKMAYNPANVIAALQTVAQQWAEYKGEECGMAKRIPEIPLRTIDGDTCIAPAIVWGRIQNVETPQLYPVFPWRIYGMGREGLNIARNTYLKDPHALKMRSTTGWKQDNIWAACLGLTDEALMLNKEKLADGPYRFPAFWSPGFDWAPDCNKGGASMIGLQEMLLQEKPNGELMLFPAWPKDIDAKFRLKATGNRTVNAEIKGGNITYCVIVK